MLNSATIKILNFIILLPFFWAFTGLFFISSGKKRMGVFMLVSIIAVIIRYGKSTLTTNFINHKILWMLLIATCYSLFLYFGYGFESSRIRALAFCLIFLIFLPQELLSKRLLYILLIVGGVFVFSYALWFSIIEGRGRGWPLNVIPFTTYAAVIAVFSFLLIFYETKRKYKALLSLSLLMSAITLAIGQSRGVWLAFILLFVFILFLLTVYNKINSKVLFIIPLLAIVVGIAAYPKVEQRIDQTINEFKQIEQGDYRGSIGLRIKMWAAAIELAKVSPVFGLGDDHLIEFNKRYKNDRDPSMAAMKTYSPPHYHMEVLNTLVKLGVVGLLLFLMPLVYIGYYFIRYKTLGAALLLSMMLIYLLAGLTDTPLSHGNHIIFFWLMLFYLVGNKDFATTLTENRPLCR
jgi:O-antigen ligase